MENNSTNHDLAGKLAVDLQKSAAVRRAPVLSVWSSIAGYFLVSFLAAAILFFIVWNVLYDERAGETSLIAAGAAALLILILAFVVRKIVQRRARTNQLLQQTKFEHLIAQPKAKIKKLTLEQNAAALRLIQKRSDASSNSLDSLEKHLEAFKLCQEYLNLVEKELQTVNVGSPRLPALRNGQVRVQALHKKHLLSWAAESTRTATREAAVRVELNDKIESAQRALESLNSALLIYPNERQLAESAEAVREFITSIRVSHWIEAAERAAFKGQYQTAIDHYTDALFYLSREGVDQPEASTMMERLKHEIERLQVVHEQSKSLVKNLSPPNQK